MKIKQLIQGIEQVTIYGPKNIAITGISSHSKTVAPGYLFIAKRGLKDDGNIFVREAIEAGAVAVISDLYDPSLSMVTQVIHPSVADIEEIVAQRFFHNPAEQLFMVGITGTCGKTTCAYAIKHMFDQLEKPTGLISSVAYVVGRNIYPAMRTTPDLISTYRMLRDMVKCGCFSCAMEVSSHALDQGRVRGIGYDVAIFTNLNTEHLDYHGSMEAYAAAKQKLFQSMKPSGSCLINLDDPWADRMLNACSGRVITYGIDTPADIQAHDIQPLSTGCRFSVTYQGSRIEVVWPLIGRFNVSNALCVIGCALVAGVSLEKIPHLLKTFSGAPGRLERVQIEGDRHESLPTVFVDYAHKPEALKQVLQALKESTSGNIYTLFGCGGDRDRSKRPLMANIAETLSHHVVVTMDNPRNEPPEQIFEDICRGFSSQSRYELCVDRKEAIARVITQATENDIVLIAGKGHEDKQYLRYMTIDFDDRKIARECMLEKNIC